MIYDMPSSDEQKALDDAHWYKLFNKAIFSVDHLNQFSASLATLLNIFKLEIKGDIDKISPVIDDQDKMEKRIDDLEKAQSALEGMGKALVFIVTVLAALGAWGLLK